MRFGHSSTASNIPGEAYRLDGGRNMPRVELDTPAPDFTLEDWRGGKLRLSDFRGRAPVVLIFNRGFT